MKAELKAYEVCTVYLEHDNESVQRGYLEHRCAKTEHEARRKLLTMCFNYGVEANSNGEPLTYINLRTRRRPDLDLFMVDGKLKSKPQIECDQKVLDNRNMLNKMLADNPGAYAYIRKGGYYYGPNNCGYTENRYNAGVYTIDDAIKSCLGCDLRDYMLPELINIEQHNNIILNKINQLQTKLI